MNNILLYDLNNQSFDRIIKEIPNPLVYSILPQSFMFIIPTVGTIHDCRECDMPNDIWELFYKITPRRILVKFYNYLFPRAYKARCVNILAKKIGNKNFIGTTITKFTQQRLNFYFKKNLPIFATPFTYSNERASSKNLIDTKFFLLISCDRWLKNNLRAIIALDTLFSKGEINDYRVKLVGIKSLDEFKLKIKNKDKFETYGYVEQTKLNDLFKTASVFIFPSLYEGFGIPPLEAFKYGTPVIASNSSSIPEICGDAVLYFNPYSTNDISNKILHIIKKDVYKEYSNRAVRRYNNLLDQNLASLDSYIDFVLSKERSIYGEEKS